MKSIFFTKIAEIIIYLACFLLILDLIIVNCFFSNLNQNFVIFFDIYRLILGFLTLNIGFYFNSLKEKSLKINNRSIILISGALIFIIISFSVLANQYQQNKNFVKHANKIHNIEDFIPEVKYFGDKEIAIRYYYQTGKKSKYLNNGGVVDVFIPDKEHELTYQYLMNFQKIIYYYKVLIIFYLLFLILSSAFFFLLRWEKNT